MHSTGGTPWRLLLPTLLLHVIFLASVFDIYFRSPIIPSARRHVPDYTSGQAPARRIVLFVADGLRADSLYQDGAKRVPFLRKVIRHLGRWGVSHTRVPTESRPGHVALIAGMYEDPSAITKGWRENPVDFDTIFNASRYAWLWGSPDILPMFEKGVTATNEMRVFSDCYTPKYENFNAQDPSGVDRWVFDRVNKFFTKAEREDLQLRSKLMSDKIVLFLHLLGLDTNGHVNKPHSAIYADNLGLVDAGVAEIVRLAENFWSHDGRTAYIFTSDHGMTNWGSHGAGMPHETETPIVSWGAGIKSPTKRSTFNSKVPHHVQNAEWKLETTERLDVNQTDVAPLMAALLGIGMPQNSAGRLPTAFLKMHPSHVLLAKIANLRQVHEQYLSIRERFQQAHFHSPFPEDITSSLDRSLDTVTKLERQNRPEAAEELIDELFDVSAKGIAYYQRYHRTKLYVAITVAYAGFIILLVINLAKNFTPFVVHVQIEKAYFLIITCLSCFTVFVYVLLQRLPVQFFLYLSAPVLVWSLVTYDVITAKLLPLSTTTTKTDVLLTISFPLAMVEMLVASFIDRRFLSVAIFVNMAWQLLIKSSTTATKLSWVGCCIILSAFSFQPSIGKENNSLLALVAGSVGATASLIVVKVGRLRNSKQSLLAGTLFQVVSGMLVHASVVIVSSSYITICHVASWTVLVSSIPVAFLTTPPTPSQRLLAMAMSLQSVYVLLSVAYEGLFSLFLLFTLLSWLLLELGANGTSGCLEDLCLGSPSRQRRFVSFRDVFTALDFLFFATASFFGTGNIASVNSFDPRSIRTLVSVFDPFIMGSLLLLKVLLPFLMVACFVFTVQNMSRAPTKALFMMVLLFSDVMALHFFFLVTDEGSWLDIGTSLSHYVIAQATVIFLQLLFVLAEQLMLRGIVQRSTDRCGF